MADARALLAAERKARRISHPYLQYTKAGLPVCKVCQLNVKSEALWEGHLRSVNHRKNVNAAEATSSRSLKRKLEDVEEEQDDAGLEDGDGRKKPKSVVPSLAETRAPVDRETPSATEKTQSFERHADPAEHAPLTSVAPVESAREPSVEAPEPTNKTETVDEDEWAAFEREIAPIAQADYSDAVISAAPMSTEELARRRGKETQSKANEAGADMEDEERRAEEEEEIMEDLGERVKKLREKREALRNVPRIAEADRNNLRLEQTEPRQMQVSDEDEDDDVDDWYS